MGLDTIIARKNTDFIVVHCAATPPEVDIGATEIDQWHRERGWDGCGYHYVIRRDGTLEDALEGPCRPEWAIGAHVGGHNHNTVGVCLVGGVAPSGEPENNFTKAQFDTLSALIVNLRGVYGNIPVIGHRDFAGVRKACPSFDVSAWLGEPRSNVGGMKVTPFPGFVEPPKAVKPSKVTIGLGTHLVRDGETLWKIARQYRTSPEVLRYLNPKLTSRTLIRTGETFTVPVLEVKRG